MTPGLSVSPRQLLRPARAVATTLVGAALTVTHALAQELGATTRFTSCATAGICPPLGQLAAVTLCLVVAFAAISGMVLLRKFGRHARQADSTVLACIFLAALIAAGAGAWMAAANPFIFEGSANPIVSERTG